MRRRPPQPRSGFYGVARNFRYSGRDTSGQISGDCLAIAAGKIAVHHAEHAMDPHIFVVGGSHRAGWATRAAYGATSNLHGAARRLRLRRVPPSKMRGPVTPQMRNAAEDQLRFAFDCFPSFRAGGGEAEDAPEGRFRLVDLFDKNWSGRRDSNPRPRPWQGRALPLSYARAPIRPGRCRKAALIGLFGALCKRPKPPLPSDSG
jgi:hypothetical protein